MLNISRYKKIVLCMLISLIFTFLYIFTQILSLKVLIVNNNVECTL